MYTTTRLNTITTRYAISDDEGPSVCAVCETDNTSLPAEIYAMITVPESLNFELQLHGGWEEKDPPFAMDGFVIYTIRCLMNMHLPPMERYGQACVFAERTICEFDRVLFGNKAEVHNAPQTLQ